jgi:hypothetical protein
VGGSGNSPTSLISGMLSEAPDEVLPSVATAKKDKSMIDFGTMQGYSLNTKGCFPSATSLSRALLNSEPRSA